MDLWLDHIGSMILIDFGGPQMPWEGISVLFQVSICGNHLRSQRFSGTGLLHRQWWNYTTDTLQETFTLRKVFTCVFLTKSWGFLIRISHQCSFGIGGSYSIYSIYSMGTYNKPEWIKGIWISHGRHSLFFWVPTRSTRYSQGVCSFGALWGIHLFETSLRQPSTNVVGTSSKK